MPSEHKAFRANPDVCLDCQIEGEACDTCAWAWFRQAWAERKGCEVPAFYWWAATRYGCRRVAVSVMRAGWHSEVRKFRAKRRSYAPYL